MAQVSAYYADKGLSAAYYDLVTAHDASLHGDVDVYAAMAPPGGSILELGAGTGRVAAALAERGFSVLGLDISPAMLAQAEARRAALPAEVAERLAFRRGDMGALQLGRTFDTVIAPFFGLAHLPAGAAWRNVFAGVAAHLNAGGRAAFHLPEARLMTAPAPDPKAPVASFPVDDAGRRLQLFVHERRFREPMGRFDQVIDYVVVDAAGAALRRSRERLTYYAADPAPFAQAAGLVADGEPQSLGGVGSIHVFRKP
jgi:SAM-dependent methyltransferase